MTRRDSILFAGGLLILFSLALAPLVAAQKELQLMIISPSNGEIFYASKLGYIVAIPITGQVTVAEGSPEAVEVQLTIDSFHEGSVRLTTQPDEDGFFIFYLDLNPENLPLPTVGERFFDYSVNCPDCHFSSEAALPLGQVDLQIMAVHPDGTQTTAERHVTVDRSELATLPVQVILDGGADFAIDNIPVQAEARQYDWRGRLFRELTSADGRVDLNVEVLTQRETIYYVSVPPTMINNRRYQSAETTTLTIPPGAGILDPVTLAVYVENGSINGRVQASPDLPAGIDLDGDVLAVALPGGLIYNQAPAQDSSFAFSGLPLGSYLLTADNEESGGSWAAQAQELDLLEQSAVESSVLINKTSGTPLHGRLIDENSAPISFAWLAEPGQPYSGHVSPLNGQFELNAADGEARPIQVTAPGYWSETVQLKGGAPQEIALRSRPDLRTIPWGDGRLFIPPESVTIEEGDVFSLVRGWVWGANGRSDPFLINLEGAELAVEAADFALEYVPGDVSWLYVNDGTAQFTSREGVVQQIEAGEMMALGDGVPAPYPVSADERVIRLFREGRKPASLLLAESEPTAVQRAGASAAKFGQDLSQIIVAVFYSLILLSVAAVLLLAVRRLFQVRK